MEGHWLELLVLFVYVCDFLFSLAVLAFLIAITTSFHFEAPFVPTPSSLHEKICMALDIQPGDVVYELGSGDSRVLRGLRTHAPGARFVGVERNLLLWAWSRVQNRLAGSAREITVRRGNFFETDVRDATKLYLYLLPGVMKTLLPKLERELVGARVASRAFPFTEKTASAIVRLAEKPGTHGEHLLYVYDF